MNKKIGLKVVSSMLLGTMCLYTMPVRANTKDETVYSKINNNGDSYSTIVSTKLSNDDNKELLSDLSNLLNIENTNGDETFTQQGETIVWNANGNKIQYQGKSEESLPVTCTIKYELDGEEMEAKDIVGKTGTVKITLKYTNNDVHTVKVNGKYVKMYTPFVVVAGTSINNDNNSDITISSGKIVDNGTKSLVIGMCMPGLQESLGIQKNKFNIPDSIEMTMNAKDFEMNNIIAYATPKVIESNDLNILNDLDKVYSKVQTLQSSSTQLVEGTAILKDGTEKLDNGAGQLRSGIKVAYNGASEIKTAVAKSTSSLLADKSEALTADMLAYIGKTAESTSTAKITEQLGTIGTTAENSATMQINAQLTAIGNQAEAIAETTVKSQLTAIGNQASTEATNTINSQLAAIGANAKKTAEDTIKPTLGTIGAQAGTTAESSATLSSTEIANIENLTAYQLSQNASFQVLTAGEQATVLAFAKSSAVEAAKQTAKSVAKTTADKTAQSIALTVAGSTAETTAKQTASQVAGTVASTTAQSTAQATAKQVAGATAKQTATTVAKQVASGTAQSTALTVAGTAANETAQTVAKTVANQVKGTALLQVANQMKVLEENLGKLTSGLNEINSKTDYLTDGTNSLYEGAQTLNEGMTKFDSEGIQTICNYINGDVKDLTSRVEALKDLADEYNTFTKLNNGDKGSVKFIMVVDNLKKDNFKVETNNNNQETNENLETNEIANQNKNTETSEN